MTEPETHLFNADGGFPNSRLPLLVYRRALPTDPGVMEQTFAANGWSNSWRDSIFDYHHFHSIAHEVLGIASGEVIVALGGPHGEELTLGAGDVVVFPAGVAHRNVRQRGHLLVVGAYPNGADYDIRRGDPAELDEVTQAIAALRLPDNDPVTGSHGGTRNIWIE